MPLFLPICPRRLNGIFVCVKKNQLSKFHFKGVYTMNKLISILLALSLVLSLGIVVFAEGEEQVEYTTAEYEEAFIYTKSDDAFKKNYKTKECDEQGTIVAMEYDTPAYMFNELLGVNEMLHKKLYVYLPYGYDPATQYNILYLMHGGGDSQE